MMFNRNDRVTLTRAVYTEILNAANGDDIQEMDIYIVRDASDTELYIINDRSEAEFVVAPNEVEALPSDTITLTLKRELAERFITGDDNGIVMDKVAEILYPPKDT